MKDYNIYFRKDGRWEGRIPKPSENGKRKYKSFFGPSKEAVRRMIDEFYREKTKDISLSFIQIYEEWFNGVKYHIKESTAANYTMKADKHLIPVFGELDISKICETDIHSFIDSRKKIGLSDRYISDIISLMRSVCKYASRKYQVNNPLSDIRLFKRKQAEVRLLDRKEYGKLAEYVMKNHSRTNLGVAIAMGTGSRIGELCAFRGRDIDYEKRILTVNNTIQRIQIKNGENKTKLLISEPKSDSSKRVIPIPEELISYLEEFKVKDDEFILSGTDKPIEPRTMQNRFARILNNVNLPSVHFHSLRHYFASDCVRLGFDIKSLSELLGHSNVEITLNRYVHSSFDQKREYMNRIKFSVKNTSFAKDCV